MKPVPLGGLLDRVTKKLGLAPRLREGLAVYYWPRVVGPEIAARSIPGPVRDKVLIVRTEDPALAHLLAMRQQEILHRFRSLLGGQYLRAIHLRIGQIPPAGAAAVAEPPPPPLSAERERQLAALAAGVPDPALAASFLRAARAWARSRGAAERDGRDAYLALVTGDTWPTAAEIQRAWEEIRPAERDATRDQAIERLRRKILERLARPRGRPEALLLLRGDLRRLAMIARRPPGGSAREAVAELLGPEAMAAWPEED